MTPTISVSEQAQALMRHPAPVAWDRSVADSMIGQTTQAVVTRLAWPTGWLEQLNMTPDPSDERLPHDLIRAVDRAQAAIDAGMVVEDLQAVVLGCQAWWHAYKNVAQAADAGYFIVEPHEAPLVYMLPKINDPVASWDDLLHIMASPDLPHPMRIRWMNADGTARRDAWAPK